MQYPDIIQQSGKLIRNQVYIDSLPHIQQRAFDFETSKWVEKKQSIGELRIAIVNLKEDLTNSQAQAIKVMTFNRISPAGIDAKKVKICFDEVRLVQQLIKHKSKEDAWLSVQGIVYDITDYVAKHPGGRIIMEGAGKDATNLFSRLVSPDKYHSWVNASFMLKGSIIGSLDFQSVPKETKSNTLTV